MFVELIVNRPIRRTFRPAPELPASSAELLSPDPFHDSAFDDFSAQLSLDVFHYHVPVELEAVIQPGHLVWAPFGAQRVQGIVARLVERSPVPTKPIQRLARPEPVLTAAQLALAAWIAEYYVAPLSEAVKLFLPPGLLSKDEAGAKVRVKRELQIELICTDQQQIAEKLATLQRDTPQIRVLSWLLTHAPTTPSAALLQRECQLKSPSALQTLAKQGLITLQDDTDSTVQLALPVAAVATHLQNLRGLRKYEQILEVLQASDGPLWKSDLYAAIKAKGDAADISLAKLRELQSLALVTLREQVRFRDPLAGRTYMQTTPPPLTEEQARVWQQIRHHLFAETQIGIIAPNVAAGIPWPSQRASKFLLHGVTGSGKTEIYLRLIRETLARGRQAIVLVPEIALTPQTMARFAGRFPGRVTVIHSALNQGERYDVWRYIRDGEFDVVIGPRSALFAPLARLGLIIIDEEHETSYKQNAEEWGSLTVFYDARTVAQQLAEITGSVLCLGSATPSLESYLAATQGELELLEMTRRVMGHLLAETNAAANSTPARYAELPPVEIVDMRQELRAGHRSIFSRTLLAELHATLDAGEQAIIFLNRRGARTFVMCRDCGAVQECTRCDIPLTYHENSDVLICHHCNQRYPIPQVCPECSSKRIKYFGSGTQRVEELIGEVAPRATLLRWDADTATKKGSHEEILRRFAAHEADILVGTQMIAKGLDFPLVTLVGVVAADVGLYLPDFRSSERTFQLLTQVAGRAGRSARQGRVVIQTYKPEHYAIQAAAQHDYQAFYQREIAFRHEHGYPPARRFVRLVYWDKKLEKAQLASAEMAAVLTQRLTTLGLAGEAAAVIGPAPAFFARHRGYYRWQVLVRAPDPAQILRGLPIPFGWRVDVDPVSML
ncbi:MAG: primosomal protein N' [Caldilineaceae bacterium]